MPQQRPGPGGRLGAGHRGDHRDGGERDPDPCRGSGAAGLAGSARGRAGFRQRRGRAALRSFRPRRSPASRSRPRWCCRSSARRRSTWQDVASGAAVDISLNGALPVAAQTVGGYVVYPGGASASGATVLHRRAPERQRRLRQPADASGDARGRLQRRARREASPASGWFGGTLEMLDASGAPRLHVPPPYIVGADGIRTDGALAVSGCAVDSDPSPPWGRAGHRARRFDLHRARHLAGRRRRLSGNPGSALDDDRFDGDGAVRAHVDAAVDREGAGGRRPEHDERDDGPDVGRALRPDDRHLVGDRQHGPRAAAAQRDAAADLVEPDDQRQGAGRRRHQRHDQPRAPPSSTRRARGPGSRPATWTSPGTRTPRRCCPTGACWPRAA